MKLSVVGETLHLAGYIISSEFFTYKGDDGEFSLLDVHGAFGKQVKAILECAKAEAVDPLLKRQLASAIKMVDSGEQENLVEVKGLFQFQYADIDVTTDKGDVTIRAYRSGDRTISNLGISIKPNGIFNDFGFSVNRLGMVYRYNSNCGKHGCGIPYITIQTFDGQKKAQTLEFLNAAFSKVVREQDKETIKTVIQIVTNPRREL